MYQLRYIAFLFHPIHRVDDGGRTSRACHTHTGVISQHQKGAVPKLTQRFWV